MKGANHRAICDKRLSFGDEIANRSSHGGWHALLWPRRFGEVNARLYRG
jgi:hypothetical protein